MSTLATLSTIVLNNAAWIGWYRWRNRAKPEPVDPLAGAPTGWVTVCTECGAEDVKKGEFCKGNGRVWPSADGAAVYPPCQTNVPHLHMTCGVCGALFLCRPLSSVKKDVEEEVP